ncbi:hypothetical protein DVH24_021003 [Malus domestica]|uniref:Uncharacterized protein n=1 Tax=Malus domestica TaxID=3750 RepID=A0A498J921_MALDO|nr:hypothetical protein DVH24_021003 [Malus domestica]
MAASPSQSDLQLQLQSESESPMSSIVYGHFTSLSHNSISLSFAIPFYDFVPSNLSFECQEKKLFKFKLNFGYNRAVISQQVQGAMENMFKMMSETDENSAGISEEIEKCKESALEKKKGLEEAREQVEKAAYAVLEMLNNRP